LQIGRHQAYAVGSYVKRTTREVDVRTIRIQYPVSAREGSQETSIGRPHRRKNTNITTLSTRAWAMYFDGSACEDGCGIGILLVSPRGVTYSFLVRLHVPCTNNLVEYEAVRNGMELLLEAGAEVVEVFRDSKLVISQLTEEYRCESESLFPLWMQCRELMTQFRYKNFYWIPRSQNAEANDLAQKASGYKAITGKADFSV
jgi:ribonuclease HI